MGEIIGNIIFCLYEVMLKEKFDVILILGDINFVLSVILVKRLKILIFYMEVGNRCFDENVFEEINRRLVDYISDVNLVYIEYSRRYLIVEGIRKDFIFVIGLLMIEVLFKNMSRIESSDIIERFGLEKDKYILVLVYCEENIDDEKNFFLLMNVINFIVERYKMLIIYLIYLRSWKRIEERNFKFYLFVKKLKFFGFFDYNKL